MSRPLCECHGEPMTRRNDRCSSGWRCSVRHRSAQERYRTERTASDPIFRIGEEMRFATFRRRQILARMAEDIPTVKELIALG